MLNLIDEFSRECLAIRADRKLRSTNVIDVLANQFIPRGVPDQHALRAITHQGTAKGSGLLRACLRHVAQAGGRGAWLTVIAANEGALAFYRRHGFTNVGEASFTLSDQALRGGARCRPP